MNIEIVLLKDYVLVDILDATVYEHRLFVGQKKPDYIYRNQHIQWDSDCDSLRKTIWQGFQLKPWLEEDDRPLSFPERLAGRLWNYIHIKEVEPGFDLPTKLVVIIESENFRSHAEMLLRAISWLKNNQ
ncbi:hypothetical protein ACE1CD_15415 [Aerosakkonema sp. BLCC-F183]|uniref:hypothetical protein n=1 Tax=Aerosakkonema sp. BLCC-F183 TaxID=3342834 RepID=UPI0035BAB98B